MSYEDLLEASIFINSEHHTSKHKKHKPNDSPATLRTGGQAKPPMGKFPNPFDDAFVPTEEGAEQQTESCRAPLDDEPYQQDEAQEQQPQDGCSFPSIFVAESNPEGLGRSEIQHAWMRLQSLIANALTTNTSSKDLVNMVFQFYETEIRSEYADAGFWSKRSIYQYIYSQTDRQSDNVISTVYNTIELLRSTIGTKDPVTGKIRPDSDNVKLLLLAAKTHSSLIDSKIKRVSK